MKKLIIANWKLIDYKSSLALAKKIIKIKSPHELVLAPPFEALADVGKLIKRSQFELAAQDGFWSEQGAFTGETSPLSLKQLKCKYVILGHSERRQYLGETDAMINKKVLTALATGLTPVLCIGETKQERQKKQTQQILLRQLQQDLKNMSLKHGQSMVIAYEPVWAIGSGNFAKPGDLIEAVKIIKKEMDKKYKGKYKIIYGGSVNDSNVSSFENIENLAGFLVGKASQNAAKFAKLTQKIS